MPKIGAGHNLLVRPALVLGMMRAGKERAPDGIRARCELSEHLAIRLGLAPGVRAGLQAAFEHWNGDGLPNGWTGEQIPLRARSVFMAQDVSDTFTTKLVSRPAPVRRCLPWSTTC